MHEPRQGQYNFQNGLDVESFVKLVNSLELLMIIRPGKYCYNVAKHATGSYTDLEKHFSLCLNSKSMFKFTIVQAMLQV